MAGSCANARLKDVTTGRRPASVRSPAAHSARVTDEGYPVLVRCEDRLTREPHLGVVLAPHLEPLSIALYDLANLYPVIADHPHSCSQQSHTTLRAAMPSLDERNSVTVRNAAEPAGLTVGRSRDKQPDLRQVLSRSRGLENAHHGPDAGDPGKADGCFAVEGAGPPADGSPGSTKSLAATGRS